MMDNQILSVGFVIHTRLSIYFVQLIKTKLYLRK